MKTNIDDPRFPAITYRRGASGIPTPVIRGTGMRVETLVVAHQRWGQSATELAEQYELPLKAIDAALAYYQAHQEEIDTLIRIEQEIESRHGKA